jgi:hypothetical protein
MPLKGLKHFYECFYVKYVIENFRSEYINFTVNVKIGSCQDNKIMLIFNGNGALAQLGAHHTGSVGVRGSNPLCSTTIRLKTLENQGFSAF